QDHRTDPWLADYRRDGHGAQGSGRIEGGSVDAGVGDEREDAADRRGSVYGLSGKGNFTFNRRTVAVGPADKIAWVASRSQNARGSAGDAVLPTRASRANIGSRKCWRPS